MINPHKDSMLNRIFTQHPRLAELFLSRVQSYDDCALEGKLVRAMKEILARWETTHDRRTGADRRAR